MLRLRVRAPFAAFRSFSAGSYRPSAPFLTPSAAYGLALNVAGIESRLDDGESTMTLTQPDLPAVRLAIGAVSPPGRDTLYQQLHNYPVGATGRERVDDARGNKYNIQPVRREVLVCLDACVALDGNEDLESAIRAGLSGTSMTGVAGKARYGLPFLGDNNFLLSQLYEEREPSAARWYIHMDESNEFPVAPCRLTVWIDRKVMSNTVSALYDVEMDPTVQVPPGAWTWLPPKEAKGD
jgi:CRISPR-associated protein Cas5t